MRNCVICRHSSEGLFSLDLTSASQSEDQRGDRFVHIQPDLSTPAVGCAYQSALHYLLSLSHKGRGLLALSLRAGRAMQDFSGLPALSFSTWSSSSCRETRAHPFRRGCKRAPHDSKYAECCAILHFLNVTCQLRPHSLHRSSIRSAASCPLICKFMRRMTPSRPLWPPSSNRYGSTASAATAFVPTTTTNTLHSVRTTPATDLTSSIPLTAPTCPHPAEPCRQIRLPRRLRPPRRRRQRHGHPDLYSGCVSAKRSHHSRHAGARSAFPAVASAIAPHLALPFSLQFFLSALFSRRVLRAPPYNRREAADFSSHIAPTVSQFNSNPPPPPAPPTSPLDSQVDFVAQTSWNLCFDLPSWREAKEQECWCARAAALCSIHAA